MKILADASLPDLNEAFPSPFCIETYQNLEEVREKLSDQSILLCRSTLKVTAELLKASSIQYVATASSGIDHIDQAYLRANQIQLIDAKGSNASSVADYVMACLAFLEKKQLLKGRNAGIIGLGAVGTVVHQRLSSAGFEILSFDPPKANREACFQSCTLQDLQQCHLLCIHAALDDQPSYPSKNLLNADFLEGLREKTVLINAARGGIVNESDLLTNKRQLIYCTDVYQNEPDIRAEIVDYALLCTPHIAGHCIEAKFEAVAVISRFFHQLLNLAPPSYGPKKPTKIQPMNPEQSSQDFLLSLYDPSLETTQLKQSIQLKEDFIKLRKAHCIRHDFTNHCA